LTLVERHNAAEAVEIVLDTSKLRVDDCTEKIVEYVEAAGGFV
jgi:hypothetical protein